MSGRKITFIGGGNMATAIIQGLLTAKSSLPEQITVADISPERRAWLTEHLKVIATADNAAAVRGAEIVVLAVKPQQAPDVLGALQAELTPKHLLISICAGLPTSRLEQLAPARVVRVMPNLPALIQRGVAAICGGSRATESDLALTEELFATTGTVVRVPEDKMNEVTALSGSGPGYVFAFIEALEAAGIEQGLEPATARLMAVETMRGAAEMAAKTGKAPAELRRQVCSPGGTTLAGLAAMQEKGFDEAVAAGVRAARERSAELAR